MKNAGSFKTFAELYFGALQTFLYCLKTHSQLICSAFMNNKNFESLVEAYLANELTDEEKAELTKRLDEDANLREQFREVVELEYFLKSNASSAGLNQDDEDLIVKISSGKNKYFERLGMAALVMFSLTLLWLLWQNKDRADISTVAILQTVSRDAVFNERHELPTREGSRLEKGWIHLNEGTIELKFNSGATVELEGPAVFGIDNGMRGFLESGTVKVHAPGEAQDFVVGTANMEVVDLGTRFELSIDSNSKATVKVSEGLVDLHLGGNGTPRQIQPLPAGQEAEVNAVGQILSIEGTPSDPGFGIGSGLLAHWQLDRIESNNSLVDISGNDRVALFNGNAEDSLVKGVKGEAIHLEEDRWIDISHHTSVLTKTRSFTFTAWIKGADDIIFSVSDGTPYSRIQFELWGNLLVYGWQKGALFDAIEGKVDRWEPERWYHIAVTVSGPTVTLYRDGSPLLSRSIGQRISSKSLVPADLERPSKTYIGFLPSNHIHKPQHLGGMIDDVQLYGRALDEQAVRFLFENPGETVNL